MPSLSQNALVNKIAHFWYLFQCVQIYTLQKNYTNLIVGILARDPVAHQRKNLSLTNCE